MKRVCKRKVMIDAFAACFSIENPALFEEIESLEYGKKMDFIEFRIARTEEDDYKNAYSIIYNDDDSIKEYGVLKFNLNNGTAFNNTHSNGKKKAWISVSNRCFYSGEYSYLGFIVQRLNLEFNNFTVIDLCLDTAFEISKILKYYIKNRDFAVILNGKIIHDRDEDRTEITYNTSGSLNKTDKYRTVNIKQKKAIKNKHKGVTITTYDKIAEIKNSSYKNYILDFYGNPKRLFRTEVHLNNEEIKDYLKTKEFELNPYMLNEYILEDMFFYHLNNVIRFRGKNKVIRWEYLLGRA